MQKRNAIKTIAASALLVSSTALFSACAEKKAEFKGVDITGAEYARDLPLTDHNGQPRHLKDFAGKVVVVFFGFTQCPDVCPTSMTTLAEVKRLLGEQGDRLQVIFITVDPERDTQPLLNEYLASFDPAFIALRPEPAELERVAADFKIYFKKVPRSAPSTYTMDHSAGKYIFDTAGRVRLFSPYGTDAATIASDIQILLSAV